MQVKFTYRLNTEAQRSALKLGVDASTPQTIEIGDPECILLDHVSIDSKGVASLDLSNQYAAGMGALETEYVKPSDIVSRERYTGRIGSSPYPSLDLTTTPEDVLAAVRNISTIRAAKIASIPQLQAEMDLDFETRKTAYIASATQNLLADMDGVATIYATMWTHTMSHNARNPEPPKLPSWLTDQTIIDRHADLVTRHDARAAALLVVKAVEAEEEAKKPKPQLRVALTDGTGRWFDANKAEKFTESTHWNGKNHISDATGSQWEHEALYRTASCRYILNHWSNYQGSAERYYEIDAQAAAVWLSENGEDADCCCESEFAALEID